MYYRLKFRSRFLFSCETIIFSNSYSNSNCQCSKVNIKTYLKVDNLVIVSPRDGIVIH